MLDTISQIFHNLIDPDWIQAHGGMYLVAFIIFAETGLFVGFFLPGDSLLFMTGIITAQLEFPFEMHEMNLAFWIVIISIAGILGNFVGYWFGKRSGTYLYNKKDTFFWKKKYLEQAQDFYEEKGGIAILLARFLPIIRTFAPIVAGIVKMDYVRFTYYNIVGSILWVGSMMTLGFLLGENEWVRENLEKIVIVVILITILPVLYQFFIKKKKVPEGSENSSDESEA